MATGALKSIINVIQFFFVKGFVCIPQHYKIDFQFYNVYHVIKKHIIDFTMKYINVFEMPSKIFIK